MRLAGECGYIPLSLTFNAQYLRGHWDVIEEGAASTGATCNRQDWRVIRDIVVADTDKEARQLAADSLMGRHWRESNFPLLREFDWLRYLKHDDAVADEDVTIDYLVDHVWLVGSPETVAERLKETDGRPGRFRHRHRQLLRLRRPERSMAALAGAPRLRGHAQDQLMADTTTSSNHTVPVLLADLR